ncbi:MAG: DUF2304 domain-containing protein [Candidatus Eisenbacteria sp.]|nr:DUF2304 domain-containing protein [Candidatus Eisenbacteria bacterium]
MSLRIQVLAALAAVLVTIFILELVRGKKLREEYSILWVVAAALMLVLAIWKESLFAISRFLGVHNANSLLFFLGFIFVMIYLVHLSMKVSLLTENSKTYSQHIGLLEAELEEMRKKGSGEGRSAGRVEG